MPTSNEAYRLLFGQYKEDPVFFVEHALGHFTWSRQREILKSVKENERTAVRACHGSSKTFTAAEIALWFLNCIDNSKVITTAPTHSQVEHLLWAEINAAYQTSRIRLEGECQTVRIRTSQPDHYAIGFSTDKPARAEGWHAPAVLFIFDEAKGIKPWLWDSVRGLLTGGFCRWLVISTTDGVAVGDPYYKIFRESAGNWNRIHIKASDTPYVTGEKFRGINIPNLERPEKFSVKYLSPDNFIVQIATPKYIDDCAQEWGRDSVLFQTKVDGEIVDQGADTIIKLSQVNKMFENYSDPAFNREGQEEVGADIARGGTDDCVFFRRKGMFIEDYLIIPPETMPPKERLVYVSDKLCEFADQKKDIRIKVDDTGVGGGVTDILQSRRFNVVPINFQGEPNDKNKYPDTISEMWFGAASIIAEIACPPIDRLKVELVNRRYLPLDKKGRRLVEKKDDYKKRGHVSPDMADAFLLTFYNKPERHIIWLDEEPQPPTLVEQLEQFKPAEETRPEVLALNTEDTVIHFNAALLAGKIVPQIAAMLKVDIGLLQAWRTSQGSYILKVQRERRAEIQKLAQEMKAGG